MINTDLLNQLVKEDIQQKELSAQVNTVLLKRKLLKERLINYSIIIAFIIAILLLLMFLYYLFPNKECVQRLLTQDNNKKEIITTPNNQPLFKNDKTENKKMIPKNGIDYVKHDNFVYKRVWKDGLLVKETKLASTIKESRKLEEIPQLSHEKTFETKNDLKKYSNE